tara:strand:- start:449 stop:646 length:198 start_codon:yes stop_codon:yes gene_type:complete
VPTQGDKKGINMAEEETNECECCCTSKKLDKIIKQNEFLLQNLLDGQGQNDNSFTAIMKHFDIKY